MCLDTRGLRHLLLLFSLPLLSIVNRACYGKEKQRQSLTCLLWLLSIIRQYVAGALQQVVSEEEPPEWVLDTATHLDQVLQNVLTRLGEGTNVNHTHCD